MPSQREIRRRIGSVRNIKQITRAMQFVAASKLKRAQDATLAARPYSEKLDEVLADLAAVLGAEDHPLLAQREDGKRLIVLVTTDRGLAGPAQHEHHPASRHARSPSTGDLTLVTVGRKGHDAMRRAGVPIAAHFERLRRSADLRRRAAARPSRHRRLPGRHVRRVDVVYIRVRLDARPASGDDPAAADPARPRTPRASPATSSSSSRARPRSSSSSCRATWRRASTRPCSSSRRARSRSRMVAMKNATENAEELIEDLTLTYNKVRQSNITREMIEIATGANAR